MSKQYKAAQDYQSPEGDKIKTRIYVHTDGTKQAKAIKKAITNSKGWHKCEWVDDEEDINNDEM